MDSQVCESLIWVDIGFLVVTLRIVSRFENKQSKPQLCIRIIILDKVGFGYGKLYIEVSF
jgi:hypothetical protein